MEHAFKSMYAVGDTVSVHKPGFYAKRFMDFCFNRVFKRGGENDFNFKTNISMSWKRPEIATNKAGKINF